MNDTRWDAVHHLLTAAAVLVEDDEMPFDHGLLDEGARCSCALWGLPESETAEWVAAEAKYRIACMLSILPGGRNDPMITAIIDILGLHPRQIQARVMRAAARRVPA